MLDSIAKTDQIEKSLAQLLRQLKKAKRKEAQYGFNTDFAALEMLNDGIKTLENTQLASVNDFDSVKELVEIELLFKESSVLNRFEFPLYKTEIECTLLLHATMDVYLDRLEDKSSNLFCRGHRLAASEAKSVVFDLRNLNCWYFNEEKIDYNDYRTRALQTINSSRSVLEQHRGYKNIVINLIVLIMTAGTAFLFNKICTGHFLFFQQTDSAKHLNELAQRINLSPKKIPSMEYK